MENYSELPIVDNADQAASMMETFSALQNMMATMASAAKLVNSIAALKTRTSAPIMLLRGQRASSTSRVLTP